MVNGSVNPLLVISRSELPLKLLPLNISHTLEMALEQKELDQEPGAGRCVLSRTDLRLEFSGIGKEGWLAS